MVIWCSGKDIHEVTTVVAIWWSSNGQRGLEISAEYSLRAKDNQMQTIQVDWFPFFSTTASSTWFSKWCKDAGPSDDTTTKTVKMSVEEKGKKITLAGNIYEVIELMNKM